MNTKHTSLLATVALFMAAIGLGLSIGNFVDIARMKGDTTIALSPYVCQLLHHTKKDYTHA